MKTDSEKLLILADWFDRQDHINGIMNVDEVQKDLRRIAINIRPKVFFRVVFRYDSNVDQGASIWKERVEMFDAADDRELQEKIQAYKRGELDQFSRYYPVQVKDITKA